MGLGSSGGNYGYAMGMDDFLRKGMQSGKGSGGLGRKVFNILGGAEDDPSKHSGMKMLERGKSQAQNPGGLGKKVIRTVIKSYLGGGLDAIGDLGTLSDAAGVMDTVKAGAGSVLDATLGPVRNALGDIPLGVEGIQGFLSEKLGVPVGAGGVQDFITEKTGIPIGGPAMVGKGLEMAGVNPYTTEHVQNIMSQRDPERKYGNVNQAMDPSEYLQPASVPTNASRQIDRQGGVRNMVAQRFGEGSPITNYIGAFDHGTPHDGVRVPGNPSNGTDSTRVVLDATPGERIHVEPAPDPNVSQPLYKKGEEWRPLSERFQGLTPTGDVGRPADRHATGLQQGLAWLSLVAGKFQGDPTKEIDAIADWNKQRDYREALMHAQAQMAAEGPEGNRGLGRRAKHEEATQMQAMRASAGLGAPQGYFAGEGETRYHPTAPPEGTKEDEWNRRWVQEQIKSGGKWWDMAPDEGYAGWETGGSRIAPDKGDRVVYRGEGANQQKATAQYNPAVGKPQFYAWDRKAKQLTWHDTPQESNWRDLEAGFGAAALVRMRKDDAQLISMAQALDDALEGSDYEALGAWMTLPKSAKAKLEYFYREVTSNRPSELTDPAELELYLERQQRAFDVLAGHMSDAYKGTRPPVIPVENLR